MSTEDKRRRLRRLVPPWSFLTCLRRPYLFPRAGKDRGEKGAGLRLVHPASDFRWEAMFQASFHTILTSRASWYAPPDTGASNLQLVALERLLSIEGADEIRIDVTFLRGKAPLAGELSPKVTERSSQICSNLSVSASPSHLPWKGRLWVCAAKAKSLPHPGKAFVY